MKIATRLREYVKRAGICEFRILDSLKLASSNTLRVTLNRLAKAGEIHNPTRGVYVSREADPFMVATSLGPGYLSLGTALYLHHLVDEYPFTIYVASESRKTLRLGEHEIRYFKAKNYRGLAEKPYRMATEEKAVYDCLLHANLVGYQRIAKALHGAEFSAKTFLRLCKGENGAFFQRLGYILSLLPSRGGEKERILDYCKKNIGGNAYLQGRAGGKFIPEWKLVDNVGEKVILSWWRQ